MELTQEQALKNLVATYQRLKADRAGRLNRVETMRKYTFPHKSYLSTPLTGGDNPYSCLYDGTGQLAASEFAANLFTHTTPSDQNWFLLTPPAAEPELANDRGYAEMLAARTERLHVAQRQTNWATEIHSAFEDLADGTCCLEIAKDPDRRSGKAFVLSTRPMNEYAFLTDAAGRPHTVFTEYGFSAYEAAKRFGLAKLPDALQQALGKLEGSAYVDTKPFLNVMRPNEAWDPTSLTDRRYRYENLWVDLTTQKLLSQGGMRRLRRVVARFRTAPGLGWGFGPTDQAYAWIRCLDKSSEIVLKYGAMKMLPPSIWPDDGAFWPQDATPGAVIVGRLGATDAGKPSFLEVQGDHRVGEFLFNYYANLIMRAYMADIFQILRDTKQRTAAEVATILQRAYDVLVPPLARVKQEFFEPTILIQLELLTERDLGVDGWMYGGRELPEYRYDLEMISPLFLALKYAELQNINDAHVILSPWAEIAPEIWDTWSLDEISHVVQENLGIPNRLRRSASALRQLREARAEAAQRQAALEQAKLAGEAASKLSQPVEEGSPMAMMAGAGT